MIKRIVLSFFVAMCALTLGTSVRDARAAGGAYDVCHAPPGDPAAAFTISVGSNSALAAHLAHGDQPGACFIGPPPPTCEDACSDALDRCLATSGGDQDLETVCREHDYIICLAACPGS